MKKIVLSFLMCLFIGTAFAQNDNETQASDTDTVYSFMEQMPEYPGGTDALYKYLADNITYPKDALKKKISGVVLILFVVEKDGRVSNVTTKVPLYPSCDKEAIRAIKAMPKWKPGTNCGKPFRCYFQVPIRFSEK